MRLVAAFFLRRSISLLLDFFTGLMVVVLLTRIVCKAASISCWVARRHSLSSVKKDEKTKLQNMRVWAFRARIVQLIFTLAHHIFGGDEWRRRDSLRFCYPRRLHKSIDIDSTIHINTKHRFNEVFSCLRDIFPIVRRKIIFTLIFYIKIRKT